jgi:hypothetical protein
VYPLVPPHEPSRDFSPEVVGVADAAEEIWLAVELASTVVLEAMEETASLLASTEEEGAGLVLAATEEEALLMS